MGNGMNLRDKIAEAVKDGVCWIGCEKSAKATADAILSVIAESVKPMEWERSGCTFRSKCQLGLYEIKYSRSREVFYVHLNMCELFWRSDITSAKAAAQEDYTRRILSAFGLVDHATNAS